MIILTASRNSKGIGAIFLERGMARRSSSSRYACWRCATAPMARASR